MNALFLCVQVPVSEAAEAAAALGGGEPPRGSPSTQSHAGGSSLGLELFVVPVVTSTSLAITEGVKGTVVKEAARNSFHWKLP